MSCPHADVCPGCSYWHLSPEEQRRLKSETVLRTLREALGEAAARELPAPAWISPTPQAEGRQRLELQVRGAQIGFVAPAAANNARTAHSELVAIESCRQATPALAEWLRELRPVLPPFARAGLRLRVSPAGLRGLWIDLPNERVKEWLDEESSLERLRATADVVEIGQRRKPLTRGSDGRLRLTKEPDLRPWTRTWMGDMEVPLLSTVGDFSQPSDVCNREIAAFIARAASGAEAVLEFGSGNGNLSFPALTHARRLFAAEREERLATAARRNFEVLREKAPALLSGKEYRVNAGWLDARSPMEHDIDTYLLNPSREGAGAFLGREIPGSIRRVIMMSCHLESYARDAARLAAAGFVCPEWSLLDQFPQTSHLEILSRWVRREAFRDS